jgi:hypothetical protein
MTVKTILLKPFTFSYPLGNNPNARLTKEKKFEPEKDSQGRWKPTEIELDDDIAKHPWIKEHYADGAIERPEVTAARAEAEQKKLEKQQEDNAIQLGKAQQALARSTVSRPIDMTDEAVQRELNTPVNVLRGSQGTDIDKPIDQRNVDSESSDETVVDEEGNDKDGVSKPINDLTASASGKKPVRVSSKARS